MSELKVYVDGVQRVVCGVNDNTSCQDVIIALAQATGQTGKFKLVERNPQTNEKRTLKPQEKPLHVMSKWNQLTNADAFFMLVSVGDTPNTSRPPSSMSLPMDRFRQPGDGSDLSEFPKQRQASIRRSMTFNGYKGGGSTTVKDLKEKVNQKAEKLHNELTELIDVQKLRLNEQQKQLESVDTEIKGLNHLENITTQEMSDKELQDMDKTLQANNLAVEELEMWEHELDIEQQLQSELLGEVSVLKEKIVLCEEKIKLQQKEAGHILDQIEREGSRQKRVAEEQLQRHLDDVHGEVKLLEEEYRGYSANLEETNKLLKELRTVFDEKQRNEQKLIEELEELYSVEVSGKQLRVPLAVIDIDEQLSPELSPSPTSESVPATTQQFEESQHNDEFQVQPQRRFKSNPRELVEAAPSSDNPDVV